MHDFLEQGVYDIDVFLERSRILSERLKDIDNKVIELQQELEINRQRNKNNLVPKLDNLFKLYFTSNDVKLKNDLLKDVLYKVEYSKGKNSSVTGFKLTLYPKIY